MNSKISESLLGIWEQNLASFVENHKTRKRKTKSARKCDDLIWVKRRTGGFEGSNPDQLEQEEKRKQSCKRREKEAFHIESKYYIYEQ